MLRLLRATSMAVLPRGGIMMTSPRGCLIQVQKTFVSDADSSGPSTQLVGNSSDSSIRCYNCNSIGHMARNCPSPASGARRAIAVQCYRCGQYGHMARDCQDETRCYNCGQSGHLSKDCTLEGAGDPNNKRCYNCREVGHISRNCPQLMSGGNKGGTDSRQF